MLHFIRPSAPLLSLVLLSAGAAVFPAAAGQSETPRGVPFQLESLATAELEVEVDYEPCLNQPPQCAGYRPDPATRDNDQPVRLVIQIASPRPFDTPGREDFDLQVVFPPVEGAGIRVLECPDCFEAVEGGTYALWVVPDVDVWVAGTYYLRLRLTGNTDGLPALVRLDFTGMPVINQLPAAAVVASPPTEQIIGRTVTFDGSASTDPDGDLLTCFQWSINSDLDPYDEVVQGVAAAAIQRTYPVEMVLDVILRVSDDPALTAECAPNAPPIDPNRFSPNLAVVSGYVISCGNAPPVADAGPDLLERVGVAVRLDGRASFDNETPIDRYFWSCGNGSVPIPDPQGPYGSVVYCVYFVPGTYTASLTVTDRGTGAIDPDTGTWECQKRDTDTATVEIVAP